MYLLQGCLTKSSSHSPSDGHLPLGELSIAGGDQWLFLNVDPKPFSFRFHLPPRTALRKWDASTFLGRVGCFPPKYQSPTPSCIVCPTTRSCMSHTSPLSLHPVRMAHPASSLPSKCVCSPSLVFSPSLLAPLWSEAPSHHSEHMEAPACWSSPTPTKPRNLLFTQRPGELVCNFSL